MTETAYDRVARALEAAGAPRPPNDKANWRCPAHEDSQASLSVSRSDKGVLLHCHAGCSVDDVLSAIALAKGDLFDEARARNGNGADEKPGIVATYDYVDENGELLFQTVRMRPKDFRQRRRGPDGDWVWDLSGVRPVIYRLPRVLAAVEAGHIVFIVEGEKDVEALEAAGYVATCNPMGAGKWRAEFNAFFAGALVSIVTDLDTEEKNYAGQKHAKAIAEGLEGVAADVTLLQPALGKDVADHLGAGYTVEQLVPFEDPEAPKPDPSVRAFLDEPEPEYDWVVEGLLERGDRLILTGPEGGGKSTLLRQMAVQLGAGIHPFTLEEIPPVRVMLLDLENSKRQVRRKIRPLWLAAEQLADVDPEQIRVRVVAEGIDLSQDLYQLWLDRRLEANRPDVLICGPLYKLANGDPTEEKTAKPVATFLDRMRAKYGIAVIIEAHSPHPVGTAKRVERPYGWSGWLRWPEFGLYLDKAGPIRHWRGARDERAWPSHLKRGGEWPWTPYSDARALTFAQILEECRRAGKKLSYRELADRIDGADKNTIERAIKANRKQWEDVIRELGGDPGEEVAE
jgi:hypothetical protein